MESIVAAGARLEVERIGGAGQTTLVFLHEGLGSVSQWRDFPRAVAESTGCPALIYSRVGYGRSDPVERPRPLTFMHDEARRALPELLSQEGIEDAILIGHSDGASIALIYAGESSPFVRGLILEAPHVFVEEVCVRSIEQVRAEYGRTDLRDKLARYHTDVDGAFYGWADAWLDPAFRSWDITGFLSAIRAPVLVIQGEHDEYGTVAQVDAVERGVAGRFERLILPGCGHSPHREKPEATLAAMVRFIRGLGLEGGV
jgi:pimeloyl-ACP methyl ester carboxylesterase